MSQTESLIIYIEAYSYLLYTQKKESFETVLIFSLHLQEFIKKR